MTRKTVSSIMLTLLSISMFTLTFNIQPAKAESRTWIVDDDGPADFSTIQEAINHAAEGDTVFVHSGIYYEEVIVDKTLSLIGENKTTTIVDGGFMRSAFEISANNVLLSGFKMQHTALAVKIKGRNNIVVDNYIQRSCFGGIWLEESSRGNIVSHNTLILVDFPALGGFLSVGNTFSHNTIISVGTGIYLSCSDYNIVLGNSITSKQECGILLSTSSFNVITENTVWDSDLGIYLCWWASGNSIHHNNFINNLEQARLFISVNRWHDDYPSGGNYWSDYIDVDEKSGPDQDLPGSDGVWDHAYVIDDYNQDNYPLIGPWIPTPTIPTTIDELKTEIEELGLEGEVDNQGIVTSLIAKLNVAQKLVDKGKIEEAKSILEEDFIPQVQNITDVHITPEAADILIESAEYIISHL
jgi:parallel beta-helix repeat protein